MVKCQHDYQDNEIQHNNALHNETQYYNIKCYEGEEDVREK
jgi:hypothetical protein